MLADSHCHFDLILENRDITEDELFSGMKENSVARAVQVSIDPSGLQWSLDFALKHRDSGISFTAGVHPSSTAGEEDLVKLSSFVARTMQSEDAELLFGIGECGLDFYRMRRPRDEQMRSFEFQIDLAMKHRLPVIVHARDAMDETLDILKKKRPVLGIMHCFPGDREEARRALDLGFYLSFAGNVTYKNATALHESARYVPSDRLLIETDAPFLTPVPLRGKKNRPHYVAHTYRFISELRKEPQQNLEESVFENFVLLRRE